MGIMFISGADDITVRTFRLVLNMSALNVHNNMFVNHQNF